MRRTERARATRRREPKVAATAARNGRVARQDAAVRGDEAAAVAARRRRGSVPAALRGGVVANVRRRDAQLPLAGLPLRNDAHVTGIFEHRHVTANADRNADRLGHRRPARVPAAPGKRRPDQGARRNALHDCLHDSTPLSFVSYRPRRRAERPPCAPISAARAPPRRSGPATGSSRARTRHRTAPAGPMTADLEAPARAPRHAPRKYGTARARTAGYPRAPERRARGTGVRARRGSVTMRTAPTRRRSATTGSGGRRRATTGTTGRRRSGASR